MFFFSFLALKMVKKKKLVPSEIIKKKAKLRRRIQNNPQMYEKHQLKEKLWYIKNKEKGIN